jgi:hypothetical protein
MRLQRMARREGQAAQILFYQANNEERLKQDLRRLTENRHRGVLSIWILAGRRAGAGNPVLPSE